MDPNGTGRSNSAAKSIMVSILVALIAGGSSPWWWEKVFPPPFTPPPYDATPSPTQTPPPAPVGIGACATGAAPSNEFHDMPASNGSWDWNCNGQIEREWGTCENLTQAQCDPNTNVTGAPAGFCTEIRAAGGCPPKIGECGKQGWVYPCFYNPADGRCHAGGYETATVMRCK